MEQPTYTIPVSYFECLDLCVQKHPNKVALEILSEEESRAYTYLQLQRMMRAIGSGLATHGVQPGDPVGILAENEPEWGIAFLGIWASGGIVVPLDFKLSDFEVHNLLGFSDCHHLFISSKRLESVRAMLESKGRQLKYILMDGISDDPAILNFQELQSAVPVSGFPRIRKHEDTAAIMFTSGTSADPKGVVLSHGNLLHHCSALLLSLDVSEKDSILGVLPLHHALALNANFIAPLAVGAKIIYLSAVTSQKILHGIRQSQATLFACVPQFYYLLHRNILQQVKSKGFLTRWSFALLKGLSGWLLSRWGVQAGKLFFPQVHEVFGRQLRLLASAGSYLDPEVVWDLSALGFRLLQAYGLTESTAALTVTPIASNVPGSVGRALAGVDLRIVDPDEEGTGEVIARGPNLMQGYLKRPDLTAQTIRDGWLYTGDLGRIEKDGSLYITGRAKDIIVLSNGKNIYPDELELHFLQCPMVKEVCVLGIDTRDGPAKAEKLHLVVVPDFDYMRRNKLANVGEAVRFEMESLSRKLPSYKHINSMEIRSEPLPRTTTLKIRRGQLKHEIEESISRSAAGLAAPFSSAAKAAEPLAGPYAALVEKLVRQQKQIAFPLSASHNMELDLGFDSLERLELMAAIEQELKVRFADDVAPQIYTLQDLLEGISQAKPGTSSPSLLSVSDRQAWTRLLASCPEDAVYSKHFLKAKPLLIPFFYVVMRGVYYLSKLLFRLRVSGLDQFPKESSFLICPNHLSYTDAFFLVSCLPYRVFRRLFFVGFSEYFGSRVTGFLGRLANVIPIDADTNLILAMRLAAEGLRHGKVLCIFPEGSRSIDGTLQEFRRGAAILAVEHQLPMMPVGLIGTYQVWPRDSLRIRLYPVAVKFGKPIKPLDGIPAQDSYPYDQITEQLRNAVAELISASPT